MGNAMLGRYLFISCNFMKLGDCYALPDFQQIVDFFSFQHVHRSLPGASFEPH